MFKNKTTGLFAGMYLLQLITIIVMLGLSSCKQKDLEIQGDFIAEAKVVRTPGSTERKVEIRIKVKQFWPYEAARYYVQYMPQLGTALVSMSGQPLLKAHQKYLVPLQEFIVYHNSAYSTIQKFRLALTDELGNHHELDFHFEIELPDHGNNPER